MNVNIEIRAVDKQIGWVEFHSPLYFKYRQKKNQRNERSHVLQIRPKDFLY